MCIISYLTLGIETDTLERNERERIRTAFHRTRGAGTRGTDEAARRGDANTEWSSREREEKVRGGFSEDEREISGLGIGRKA